MKTFHDALKKAIENFDVEKALALSDKIHEAEASGYELTETEDDRWEELTMMIEMHRGKKT